MAYGLGWRCAGRGMTLHHRDYGALNDRQLFDVVELCRSNAAELESSEAKANNAAEAKETAMRRQVLQLGSLALAAPVLRPTTPEQIEEYCTRPISTYLAAR
jgi:hypothetical protein